MKTLLITKQKQDLEELIHYCQGAKIKLIAQSFIQLKKITTTQTHQRDLLFFGSKNGFDFYRQNFEINSVSQLACIGEATKKHIEKNGFQLAFVGQHSGDPALVSKELEYWLKGKRITFVFSNQSTKSIVSALNPSQYDQLVVYETIPLRTNNLTTTPTIIVFTSPSNVKSFLSQYEVLPETQVVAWGKSTEKALLQANIKANYILKTASQEELTSYLRGL